MINSTKLKKYLKSRTVWVALIAGVLNVIALFNVHSVAGIPVEQIEGNKEVMASQLTVIAAGVMDVLAIVFRIRAKATFD